MQEVDNIVRILKDTRKAIKENDVVSLRTLSNQTIHTAATSQDPDNIAIAVIVYTLGKLIEKGQNGERGKYEEIFKKVLIDMENLIAFLRVNNPEVVRKNLHSIRKHLEGGSEHFKVYIQDVFRKASINKASKIYEHGISMETTASLLGITMFDLASYSGQKQAIIQESEEKTISAKERIKIAMEIFE